MAIVFQAVNVGLETICSFRNVAVAYYHFRNGLNRWAQSRATRISCVADGAFVAAEGLNIARTLRDRRNEDNTHGTERRGSVICIVIGISAAAVVFSAWTISRGVVGILGSIQQGRENSAQERTLRSLDWVIITLALPIITAGSFIYHTSLSLSLAPLWYNTQGKAFPERLCKLAQTIGKAVSRPFALIAYECAALVGVVHPSSGRTLFGKVCSTFGEPWFGDLPTFATVEVQAEQADQNPPSPLTQKDLYTILSSHQPEALLDKVKKFATAQIKFVLVKVNGFLEPRSIVQVAERYRAREFLRIIQGENQAFIMPFQTTEEEQTFLKELRANGIKQVLCPASGRFIRHPVHHKEQHALIVDKESLDQARANHQEHILIGIETFPLESFEEDSPSVEVLAQEALYVQFRKLHELNQEIAAGYMALLNPATLQTIPRMVWDEPSMHQFKCRISREPIRFIVSPNGDIAICYEEKALRKWLEENPHQLPPNWPIDIPFDSAHIQLDKSGFQGRLEMDLRDISEEIQAAGLGTAQPHPLG